MRKEVATLGAGDKVVGAAAQLCSVVLRLHNNDDLHLLVVATTGHFLGQQRVDGALGKAEKRTQNQQKSE